MGKKPKPKPSFFKIMLGDFTHQLQIPHRFVLHYNDILPKKLLLKTSCGDFWAVKLKVEKHEMFFGEGWSGFVKDNYLDFGDLLVFKSLGNSKVYVKIYSEDCCEKERILEKTKIDQKAKQGNAGKGKGKGLTLTEDDQLCDSKEPKFDREHQVGDQKERRDEKKSNDACQIEKKGNRRVSCISRSSLKQSRDHSLNKMKKRKVEQGLADREIMKRDEGNGHGKRSMNSDAEFDVSVSKDACSTDEKVVSVSKDADSSDEDVVSVSKDVCSTDEKVVSVSTNADSSDEDVVSVSKDADTADEEVELSPHRDAEVDLSVSIDADSTDEEVSKDSNSTDEEVDSTNEEDGLSISKGTDSTYEVSKDVSSSDEKVELSVSKDADSTDEEVSKDSNSTDEEVDSTNEEDGLSISKGTDSTYVVSKDVNSSDEEVELSVSKDADSTNDEVQLFSSKHANSTDKGVQLHGFEQRTRSYHRDESRPKVISSKRNPATLQETGQSTNAASRFKSKYPFFKVRLGSAYVKKGFLHIPVDFANKYLPKMSTNACILDACILDSRERTWIVRYLGTKHKTYFGKHLENGRGCFSKGWKELVVANELKVGYVCAFELIDKKNFKLKISILSKKVIK